MSPTHQIDEAESAAPDVRAALRQAMPGISACDLARFVQSVSMPEPYTPGADAQPQAGVPTGLLSRHHLTDSDVYPGVARDFHVYVSAQCTHDTPACLMIFQDGERYLGPEAKTPIVLDNLVAEGAMPPMVAAFVQPGSPGPGLPIYGGEGNRSVEYDSPDSRYARFLLEELMPAIERIQRISGDPTHRALCGISSGGHCAFAAAWHRPDAFGKVISHCGSFVGLRGGDAWPTIVRREPLRPLKIFLQTGRHDLNIVFGDWVQANRSLASALAYRGYDQRLVIGQGGHSLAHGGAILPDTLRWLWS